MVRRPGPKPTNVTRLQLRLDPETHDRLVSLAAASNSTKSDVVRRLIRGAKLVRPPKAPPPIWDQKVLAALTRIGHNINQIARELHAHIRQGVDPEEFELIHKELLAVIASGVRLADLQKAREDS